MVTWQAPRADKVLVIVLKVAQEDFGKNSKKNILIEFAIFSRFFFLRLGEWYHPHPPDAINRVKFIFILRCFTCVFY